MTEETIVISKSEYETLKRAQLQLIALEQSGVDNWDWYGEAYSDYMKAAVKAGLMSPDELDEDETEDEE